MAGKSSACKVRNVDINPCIEESDGSQKCLDAYNYDKSMCSAYFMRYKNCRKYWVIFRESAAMVTYVPRKLPPFLELKVEVIHELTLKHTKHGVMLQRRRNGVKPDMPTAEERDQIITALGGKPY